MRVQAAVVPALILGVIMTASSESSAVGMKLPKPVEEGAVSVEKAISRRRSIRSYGSDALTLVQVSQLLWSAQGVTDPSGKRAAPSAGALYPLTLYLVAGKVAGVGPGIYRYEPSGHSLVLVAKGDVRGELADAALGQRWVREAPAVFAFAATYGRMRRYGERGRMYADMEAGHAAENLLLQAVALDLGSVPVGAFVEERAAKILKLPEGQTAVYLVPVGRRK